MTDVKLDHPGGQLSMPVREAVEGPGGIDVSALLKETGFVTLDQGFVNTASTASAITYIDGDAGILRYRGYPDRPAGREVVVPRGVLPADERRAADPGAAAGLRRQDPGAHAAAGGDARLLLRLPARRAPDGGALLGGHRAVDVLPGRARPAGPRAGGDLRNPADGEASDDRGVRVQEVHRPSAAVPGQLPRLRRELPADDVRPADRPVRRRPQGRQDPGHAVHPARRPRAELLHLDRTAGRLGPGQPLRLDLGRA